MWVLLTILSAILFGIKDVILKKYSKKYKISAYSIVVFEFLISLLILIVFFFTQINFLDLLDIDFYILYLIFFSSLFLVIFSIIYVKLIEEHEVSEISPLLNLSPVFLIVLSFIFLSEMITLTQLLGITILLISTYFLEHLQTTKHKFSFLKKHFFDIRIKKKKFFILVVSMLISISISGIYYKKSAISSNLNSFEIFFLMSVFALISLLIFLRFERKLKPTILDMKKNPYFVLVSTLSALSLIIIYYVITIPATLLSLVVPLRRTSTFFSSILGGILFHESYLKQKIFIILFMIFGVILITL